MEPGYCHHSHLSAAKTGRRAVSMEKAVSGRCPAFAAAVLRGRLTRQKYGTLVERAEVFN